MVNSLKYLECCSSPMEAAMCIKVFTVFEPASYLKFHVENNKRATKFPTILDSVLLRFTLAQMYQAGLNMGHGGGGEWPRLQLK